MNHHLTWQENDTYYHRDWRCVGSYSPPRRVLVADDRLTATKFLQAASEGAAFIWRGDYHNARQLLQAVGRRATRRADPVARENAGRLSTTDFHRHRQAQAHRAQLLNRLLIEVNADLSIPLRRAPDARDAIREALGPMTEPFVVSLRELLGFIGAHEWRKKGIEIPEIGGRVHPYYGLFSPLRGEYLGLLRDAPLPSPLRRALDVGTGTGVIAALLAKRGVPVIDATDIDSNALACARENLARLGCDKVINLHQADLFAAAEPNGQPSYDLIVFNPPWIPARPTSPIEGALYDEDHRTLRRFLATVSDHLSETGQVWLILSDLAEHLGLREPGALEKWIEDAHLKVMATSSVKPSHSKSQDRSDPLYLARSKEQTILWRLAHR